MTRRDAQADASAKHGSLTALCLPVSTDRQTAENHAKVAQLARARGFEPVTYEEVECAAKARPVLGPTEVAVNGATPPQMRNSQG